MKSEAIAAEIEAFLSTPSRPAMFPGANEEALTTPDPPRQSNVPVIPVTVSCARQGAAVDWEDPRPAPEADDKKPTWPCPDESGVKLKQLEEPLPMSNKKPLPWTSMWMPRVETRRLMDQVRQVEQAATSGNLEHIVAGLIAASVAWTLEERRYLAEQAAKKPNGKKR